MVALVMVVVVVVVVVASVVMDVVMAVVVVVVDVGMVAVYAVMVFVVLVVDVVVVVVLVVVMLSQRVVVGAVARGWRVGTNQYVRCAKARLRTSRPCFSRMEEAGPPRQGSAVRLPGRSPAEASQTSFALAGRLR